MLAGVADRFGQHGLDQGFVLRGDRRYRAVDSQPQVWHFDRDALELSLKRRPRRARHPTERALERAA